MGRNYSGTLPKLDRVYSTEQVLLLYEICLNTPGNWTASGLHPSNEGLSRIFRGTELVRFHEDRRGTKRSEAAQ